MKRRGPAAASSSVAASAPCAPRISWRAWLPPVLVVAVAFAVYSNSFHVPFLFDDIASIPENSTIRDLWNLAAVFSPPKATTVAGRPVLNASLAVNYAISGLGVWSYHLFNIAIHACCGLLLYGLVRRTFGSPPLAARFGAPAALLAAVCALLWVAHPLQTESVTYIIQRAESLVALFYLGMLYALARGVLAQPAARGWLAVSVVLCAAGMGAKEVMATAPLVALLYDRAFGAGSFRSALRSRPWYYACLAATWIVIPIVTHGARGSSAGFGIRDVTPLGYALSQPGVLCRYLALVFWPAPLVFNYGWPVASGAAQIVPYAAAIAALGAATLFALVRHPAAGFAAAACVLILAPTSSFVPIADLAYEHRMYLPLAGIAALVVAGAYRMVVLRGRDVRLFERVALAAAAAAIVALGIVSWRRNLDYASHVTIWADTAAKRPGNYRAHYNLGYFLDMEGRVEEAIASYRKALEITPGSREALGSLAMALARTRQFDEATRCLNDALKGDADPAEIHMNLGMISAMRKRHEEAIGHYREVLKYRPDVATAYHNIGNACGELQRTGEAKEAYGQALRLKPDFAPPRINLANLFMAEGDLAQARAHFLKVLETQPDNAKAHLGLGLCLARQGDASAARTHMETALRLRPDLAAARMALNELAAGGKPAAATPPRLRQP